MRFLLGFLVLGAALYARDEDFPGLLRCNLLNIDVPAQCDYVHEMKLYRESLKNGTNYPVVSKLEDWDDHRTVLHPAHQFLLQVVNELDISSVCEIGAGAGRMSKLIYAQNPNLNITCVDNCDKHIEQMKENFETRTNVILPDVKVKANIVKGAVPDLGIFKSNSFDLVFTCTSLMHLPFIAAVKSAIEMKRISGKYILHVENKNDGKVWYNMTVVMSNTMSPINYLGIDCVKMYEKMGVKKLKYFEFKDIDSPGTFIVYLGEKTPA